MKNVNSNEQTVYFVLSVHLSQTISARVSEKISRYLGASATI